MGRQKCIVMWWAAHVCLAVLSSCPSLADSVFVLSTWQQHSQPPLAVAQAPPAEEHPAEADGAAPPETNGEAGAEPAGFVPDPVEPGCHVMMPEGCPDHPEFADRLWVHDWHAEASRERSVCELDRRRAFNSWCGVETAKMFFIPEPPELPIAAGCYVWLPSSCPRRPLFKSGSWMRDTWGERKMKAGSNQTACEQRKSAFDEECGVADSTMMLVPPRPMQAGCYMWTPFGCPNHPEVEVEQWKLDNFAAISSDTGSDREACEGSRRKTMESWCGSVLKMLFVMQEPPIPTEPGCYFWPAAGCPNRSHVSNETWLRDTFGEAYLGAAEDRTTCTEYRKRSVDNWCGVQGTQLVYVAQEPPPPTEPGCYIWLAIGCPKRPLLDIRGWRRDGGELPEDSARQVCESERRTAMEKYCGTKTVKMLFVEANATETAHESDQATDPLSE